MTAPAASIHRPTPDAHQAILDLLAGWTAVFPSDYTIVLAAQVPEPFHHQLVHHRHMTVVLQEDYGHPVKLAVQWSEASGNFYRRRITLTSGTPLVELGVVRIDLSYLPRAVRDEILAESTPLGRILINHQILRRIVPHHYLRVHADSPILKLYNLPTPQTLYGRLGTIFCNDQPAIELLEIVTGIQPSHLTT